MGGRGASSGNFENKVNSIQSVNFSGSPVSNFTDMINPPFRYDAAPSVLTDLKIDSYLDFLQEVNKLPSKKESIPINKIVTMQNVVNRHGVLKSVNSSEPIDVVKVGSTYYMFNGNHRATAAKLTGKKTISANVRLFK